MCLMLVVVEGVLLQCCILFFKACITPVALKPLEYFLKLFTIQDQITAKLSESYC